MPSVPWMLGFVCGFALAGTLILWVAARLGKR